MEFVNDRKITKEISEELDMSPLLVEGVISSFYSNVAKEIENSKEVLERGESMVIEIKHLGKIMTKKNIKNGKYRRD